ncbi:MAG: S1C family serine protease, partial [Verrucomicrobiota bacterium]
MSLPLHSTAKLALAGSLLCVVAISPGARAEENVGAPQSATTIDWAEEIAPNVAEHFVTVRQFNFRGDLLATGSGVLLGDGKVVTCFHAIGDGNPVEIELPSGLVVSPSELVAHDASLDLAILRFDSEFEVAGLPISDRTPDTGEAVAAMGNPGGDPGYFVTGVVAGPKISVAGQPVLPLSMAIEQGNSGGPVVDGDGELVGIVSLKDLRRPGIGYAIPSSEIQRILKENDAISFNLWIARNRLSAAHWSPDHDSSWRGRGSELHVSLSGDSGMPFRFCRSLAEPVDLAGHGENEIRVRAVSVEVEATVGRISGIAFGGEDETQYFTWSLRGTQSLVFSRVDRENGTVESIENFPIPAYLGDAALVPLAIESDGQRVFGFAGEVECGSIELPQEVVESGDLWSGLSLTLGTEARFRNFVDCFTEEGANTSLVSRHAEERKIRFLEEQLELLREEARLSHEERVREQIVSRLQPVGDIPLATHKTLLETGLLFTMLTDRDLNTFVYSTQLEKWIREVQAELPQDTPPSGMELAGALQKVVFEERGYITQHDEELLRGARIAEDPRRVFEDHEAATLSTQAVMLDIVRACGFPDAAATHSPGMVLLDREADWENAAFLHTCTAEFIPLSGLSGGGCGIGMVEGASAKDIPILNDNAFLTLWLLQQKNQITEADWPEKIVPYLETLVELSADDVGSQAELALFQLT